VAEAAALPGADAAAAEGEEDKAGCESGACLAREGGAVRVERVARDESRRARARACVDVAVAP
jgi:hypothetical protein